MTSDPLTTNTQRRKSSAPDSAPNEIDQLYMEWEERSLELAKRSNREIVFPGDQTEDLTSDMETIEDAATNNFLEYQKQFEERKQDIDQVW